MTITYGNAEIPDEVYHRAIEYCARTEDGHWIYQGSKCGERNHPQIGCRAIINGEKKTKVMSVARLIYTVQFKMFPYQLRRDRALCGVQLCVNPNHFYVILEKPEERPDGKRNRNVIRIPVSELGAI